MDPTRVPPALADLSTSRPLTPRGSRTLPPRMSAAAHRHLLVRGLLRASDRLEA